MQAVNQAMAGQALPSGLHGHHYSAEAWQTIPPYDADMLQASPPASRTPHAKHSSIESKPLNNSHGALPRESTQVEGWTLWKAGRSTLFNSAMLASDEVCESRQATGLGLASSHQCHGLRPHVRQPSRLAVPGCACLPWL